MRKKSHISLSRGVIKGLGESNIIKHRYTFYIGSAWDKSTSYLKEGGEIYLSESYIKINVNLPLNQY